MQNAPKSVRIHLAIFGRTNVGKSSFLNLMAGQDIAITSPVPGTTTDVVEKTMELLPLGPVVILDTAGLDDRSELAGRRMAKTQKVFDRADVVLLVTEPDIWTDYEEEIREQARARSIPLVVIVNKIDLRKPSPAFTEMLRGKAGRILFASSVQIQKRDEVLGALKGVLMGLGLDAGLGQPALIGDLVKPGGCVVLVVPIDLEAPKGRIILPQVQVIRDALDHDAMALVVKEREYARALSNLKEKPDLVVCDSQVVQKMTADTPPDVRCTTFSILFARMKGDLDRLAAGVNAVGRLKSGDRVLIAEGCTHHAVEDDIGKVKIPRWLRQFTGADLDIRHVAGRDYPDDLYSYKLVVHCGSCMLTRRETLCRLSSAAGAGVPVTNYGVCISYLQGVIERVLGPFPSALEAYRRGREAGGSSAK